MRGSEQRRSRSTSSRPARPQTSSINAGSRAHMFRSSLTTRPWTSPARPAHISLPSSQPAAALPTTTARFPALWRFSWPAPEPLAARSTVQHASTRARTPTSTSPVITCSPTPILAVRGVRSEE
eukprot:3071535-Rhodomonas_salina.1